MEKTKKYIMFFQSNNENREPIFTAVNGCVYPGCQITGVPLFRVTGDGRVHLGCNIDGTVIFTIRKGRVYLGYNTSGYPIFVYRNNKIYLGFGRNNSWCEYIAYEL